MFVGNVTRYNSIQNTSIYQNKNTAALMNAVQSSENDESTSYNVKSARMDSFVSARSIDQSEMYAVREGAGTIPAVPGFASVPLINEDPFQTASWSAVIDPSQVSDGTIISVNGVNFEFATSDRTDTGENIRVEIGENAKGTADKFVNVINNGINAATNETNAAAIGTKSGWVQNFASEIKTDYDPNQDDVTLVENWGSPISCSWKKDANNGNKWTLSFTQSEKWAHTGDKIEVNVNSSRLQEIDPTVTKNNNLCFVGLTKIDLSQIRNGDILKIGNNKFSINLNASDNNVTSGTGGGIGTINIKDPGNVSDWRAAITKVDNLITGYKITGRGTLSDFSISANITNAAGMTDEELNGFLSIVNKPEVSDTDATADVVARINSPAYLKYDIQYDQFKDGDNFLFNGVRFVFDKDSNTAIPEINNDRRDKITYVTADDTVDTLRRFEDTFNRSFARKRGGVGKSVGAKKGGLQQAFTNMVALLNAGAFEMKVAFGEAGKAVAFIYAKTKEVLNDDGFIVLDDNEKWDNVEVENGEAGEGVNEEEAASLDAEAVSETGEAVVNALESNPAEVNVAPVAAASMDRAVNFSAAPVRTASVTSVKTDKTDKLEGETKAAEEKDETSEVSGISSEDDAKKSVQDIKEKILENPEEIAEAQALNLRSAAVVKLSMES